MNSHGLKLKPFRELSADHEQIFVPAFQEIPVCETRAMQIIRRELNLRRKTIERIRVAQNPGDTFHLNATKNRILICLLLARVPEELGYKNLLRHLQTALKHHDIGDAVIGEGFLAPNSYGDTDPVYNGFNLLCKALRKIAFSGTVYEPPEYSSAFSIDEGISETHCIVRPDGSITPSVPPTLLKLSRKKV